jgi:hypothetical protein
MVGRLAVENNERVAKQSTVGFFFFFFFFFFCTFASARVSDVAIVRVLSADIEKQLRGHVYTLLITVMRNSAAYSVEKEPPSRPREMNLDFAHESRRCIARGKQLAERDLLFNLARTRWRSRRRRVWQLNFRRIRLATAQPPPNLCPTVAWTTQWQHNWCNAGAFVWWRLSRWMESALACFYCGVTIA